MSSVLSPTDGGLPVPVSDEQTSGTAPASISDGPEKTDSVSRALSQIAHGGAFHGLAIGGANCAMGEYSPNDFPRICYVPEIVAYMRQRGYALCTFKIPITVRNVNDVAAVHKAATKGALARYEQALDERELTEIIGYGPHYDVDLLHAIALDDDAVVEVTSGELARLTQPSL